VADGIDALLARHDGKRIVVACHGGVIDAALRHLLDVAMVGSFELHTLNTSVTELVWRPSLWKLLRYNDAAHLHGLRSPPVRINPPSGA
jgi:2,3-bisphosphoglycerate-dependent phosphoglycerate mutase